MKHWFTRTVVKPFNKKFTNGQALSSIDNGCRSYCNCGVYIPMILVVVIMVVLLSIDTIKSSNTIVFSVGTQGKEPVFLNGIYKMAYETKDGSIDVVFNIPKGAQALLKANISKSGIDPEIFNISAFADKAGTTPPDDIDTMSSVVHNRYPLTLDAGYIINPVNLCREEATVDYIIIVHTATAYFDRRRFIRETFAAKKLFGNVNHRVLFLLGETNDPKTTRGINMEALTHGDVLQGAFVDSYHNLTHKGVMGFRWISEYCSNVKLIVKIDDDVFMNPFMFVKSFLPLYSAKEQSIACHVRPKDTSFIERGKGKWQVSADEFKGHDYYPFDYCNGYFVIMTPDLLRPLLLAARMNPFFWIDDVYLFGVLPATIGNVTYSNIGANLRTNYNAAKECYDSLGKNCTILATSQWKEHEQITLWHQVLNLLTNEEKEHFRLFKPSQGKLKLNT